MYIFKIFMDYAKEEKWLDEMARKGYSLTNASPLGYRFVKVTPEDATYKIDFRIFKSTSDFSNLILIFIITIYVTSK